MEVPFGLSGCFYPGSDKELNAACLKILLDALVDLDRAYLRTMARQGRTVPRLYETGIVYGRTLSWDTVPDMLLKGQGDCKSLTAMFTAQALEAGYFCRPVFRWTTRPKDGGLDYHILCQTDGTMRWRGEPIGVYHDPSKVLGMSDRYPRPL